MLVQQRLDALVVGDGLFVGVTGGGALSRLHQVADGLARLAALQVVAHPGRRVQRQLLRHLLDHLRRA